MAEIYRAWVGTPGGGGQALRLDGTIVDLPTKPPESEFVRKPAGAPAGDFVQTPAGEFAPIGRGTSRTEFLGEVMDRRNQQEEAMAGRLAARMGAKQKLDKQGQELGFTVSQEREMDALRNSRAEAEKRWRNGELNETQLKQFEEKIFLKQQAILPQMIRKKPTVQDDFNASLVDLGDGRKGVWNREKKTLERLDQGKTMTFKEWSAGYDTTAKGMPIQWDENDNPIAPDPAEVERVFNARHEMYQRAMGAVAGVQQAGPPRDTVGRPQLRTREDFEQVAKQQLIAMGMSEETLRRALEAEGSYIAVLRRLREEATKAAPAGDQTKKEFLKGRKTRAPIRAPSLGELRGFGGRGF